jgi:large conductance mechanosensitive channel
VRNLLTEFKKFIQRGNVIDLAVAVILGIEFGAVVKSLTNQVLMPLISVITGGNSPAFDYTFDVRGKSIEWGGFVTALVNFLIIAFAVFLIVKAVERLQNLRRQKEDEDTEIKLTEVELLEEIRDLLAAGNPKAASAVLEKPVDG